MENVAVRVTVMVNDGVAVGTIVPGRYVIVTDGVGEWLTGYANVVVKVGVNEGVVVMLGTCEPEA
jgi:hypothetical protein